MDNLERESAGGWREAALERGLRIWRRMFRKSSYRDLIAWQKALELSLQIYRATEPFPRREWYGLASQMRRAAVSIASNLAEGHGLGLRSYRRFVAMARASHAELSTQVTLAVRLGFLDEATQRPLLALMSEVGKLTQGLLNALKRQHPEHETRTQNPKPET